MAASVQKLPKEPIIVVTYTPPFKGSDVHVVNQQVAQIAKNIHSDIYRIADLRSVNIEWTELMAALQEATQRTDGTLRDEHIHSIFVGSDEMVSFAVESLQQRQYGGIHAELFSSLDEAIDSARAQIRRKD
jgi:queuine/archaeosine tRNA-ribosyltransferase